MKRNYKTNQELICFAALGLAVDYAAGKTIHWPDEEIRHMVARMKSYGFTAVIPYIDSMPGAFFETNGRKIKDIDVDPGEYLSRIARFVSCAHEQGMKVFLYFPVAVAAILNRNKNILLTDEIIRHFPGCFTCDVDGNSSWNRILGGNDTIAFASLAYPEVRSYLSEKYVGIAEKTGADGLQLEPVKMPTDENGVCVYGYEKPVLDSYGKKPEQNGDPEWIEFRGEFTVEFVREVKRRVTHSSGKLELSIVNYSFEDARRRFWPWEKIIREKLVETFYFRAGSPQGLREQLVKARDICRSGNPSCRYVACMDIKSYSAFTDAEKVSEGVKTILDSGLGYPGIYGIRWTTLFDNLRERDPDILNKTEFKGKR
ncbi:MAG: family 10 glycosylhydrolase [Victivallaceae bacterium]|nr:family 10 glycosylhydrolase [Victivallaceae bacterium]